MGNEVQKNNYDLREINENTMRKLDKYNLTENARCDINSCSVGQSFAQTLANYLGIPVDAFMGYSEFLPDNSGMVPSNPKYAKQTFTPEPKKD